MPHENEKKKKKNDACVDPPTAHGDQSFIFVAQVINLNKNVN